MDVKYACKKKLCQYLRANHNIFIDPRALFDIQVKRIHEYKRQFLNIIRVIYEYIDLRRKAELDPSALKLTVPKVVIFGGKAAPGYHRAKLVIKLINAVAERINSDRTIKDLIKAFFIPNYNVSLAELIVPASDISEHISTAGMEASGTSNMKFALNGGLIIGTLDGANIEIRDSIGSANMFIFGLTEDKVDLTRKQNQELHQIKDPRLAEAVESIRGGLFGDGLPFEELLHSLNPQRDYYLLGDDFGSYLEAHQRVVAAFKNKSEWAKMSIMSTAGMGYFSSDRSVQEYAEKIWKLTPISFEDTSNRADVLMD